MKKSRTGKASYPIAKKSSNMGASFSRLFEKTKHGVVSIRTKKWEFGEFPYLPIFQTKEEVLGVGTGVIIHSDGFILTNAHVVREAHELNVKLYGGKRCEASLVWEDEARDIALIRLKSYGKVRPLRLGSSGMCKVGETVMAIGTPLGLDHSVTTGVISGKNRVFRTTESNKKYEDVIQTDCAINPGNSGGPLLNLKGEVVGINAFSAKDRHGLSFAIGADGIKQLIRPVLRKWGINL